MVCIKITHIRLTGWDLFMNTVLRYTDEKIINLISAEFILLNIVALGAADG